eukprot:UN11419
MPKKCENTSDKERYQVPLELNQRDFTLETKGITNTVFIRGPKKILKMTSYLATCDSRKRKQIIRPTIIMRND